MAAKDGLTTPNTNSRAERKLTILLKGRVLHYENYDTASFTLQTEAGGFTLSVKVHMQSEDFFY